MFSAKCMQCGRCCKGYVVPAGEIPINVNNKRSRYSNGFWLEGIGKACPHLDENNQCLLHNNHKPSICKNFACQMPQNPYIVTKTILLVGDGAIRLAEDHQIKYGIESLLSYPHVVTTLNSKQVGRRHLYQYMEEECSTVSLIVCSLANRIRQIARRLLILESYGQPIYLVGKSDVSSYHVFKTPVHVIEKWRDIFLTPSVLNTPGDYCHDPDRYRDIYK